MEPIQILAKVCGPKAHVQIIRGDKLVVSEMVGVPSDCCVVRWFETDLVLPYTGFPVRSQATRNEEEVTLYFDSRFFFDCFYTDSNTKKFSDAEALRFFGPKRVGSHFRRRQVVLVRVSALIRRYALQGAWKKLSTNRENMEVRLGEALVRHWQRNRTIRTTRRLLETWKNRIIQIKARNYCLLVVMRRNLCRFALFQFKEHHEESKENCGPTNLLYKSFKSLPDVRNRKKTISPKRVLRRIVRNTDLKSPSLDAIKGINSGSHQRIRTSSLSICISPTKSSLNTIGSPPMAQPPRSSMAVQSIASVRRLANGVRRQRPKGRKSTTKTVPPLASMLLIQISDRAEDAHEEICNINESALEAWRQQALLQQKLLCQSKFNSNPDNEELFKKKKLLLNDTPLSAGFVTEWQITPTPFSSPLSSSWSNKDSLEYETDNVEHKEIQEFLNKLGLNQYVNQFIGEELVDIELLIDMCDRDKQEFKVTLSEVGVLKIGHREKIVSAILRLSTIEKSVDRLKTQDEPAAAKHTVDRGSIVYQEKEIVATKQKQRNAILKKISFAQQPNPLNEERILASQKVQRHFKLIGHLIAKQITSTCPKQKQSIQAELKSIPNAKRIRPQPMKSDNHETLRCNYFRKIGIEIPV